MDQTTKGQIIQSLLWINVFQISFSFISTLFKRIVEITIDHRIRKKSHECLFVSKIEDD